MSYDVTYVAELAPGLTDNDVLAQSVTEERILLTEDRDFGELVFRGQKSAYGVVLLRIPSKERQKKADPSFVAHALKVPVAETWMYTVQCAAVRE
jgi:hypothetical protein